MKLNLEFLLGLLVVSLFAGIIIISIGLGSELTFLNTVVSPLVCGGDRMVPAWKYEGPKMPFDVSVQGRWVCVDSVTGMGRAEGLKTTFVAGTIYGLLITGAVIVYSLQVNRQSANSSIYGPAQNA